MSFIIARRFKQQFYVMGDTRLTQNGSRINPIFGVAKSIIIHPNLCISFAGVIDYADEAIRKFIKLENQSLQNATDFFLQFHNSINCKTDFIIAYGCPNYELVLIKDGHANSVDTAWIGDYDAFRKYQGYFLQQTTENRAPTNSFYELILECAPANNSPTDIYSKMINSYFSLITDNNTFDVGDFVIPIANDSDGFRFMDYFFTITAPIDFTAMPAEFDVPLGNAREGGYTLSVTGATYCNQRIPVLYILQPFIGILYLPNDNGIYRPIIFKSFTPNDFISKVKELYNIDIHTLVNLKQ